jgi:hypothetical protein
MSLIKIKRSGTPGDVPAPSQLEIGEIAINYADGVIYYKDAAGTVKSISGSSSGLPAGSAGAQARSVHEVIATNGQTIFTIPGGYPVGFIDVVLNGSTLLSFDYTATNGISVILAEPCTIGDSLRFVTYFAQSLTNSYTKVETDNLISDQSVVAAIALG